MNWKPKTEEEVQAAQLCPTGLQPFTILEASFATSKKSGKEMLKLKLNVLAEDGFQYHIYDYVADWFMEHKFRHFFFAVNCGGAYNSGTIDCADLVGREGWARIKHGKARGDFPARAEIEDYCEKSDKAQPAKVDDDDVVF